MAETVPSAAPVGVTPVIAHVGVPVPFATVAVNCCVAPPTRVTGVDGVTPTVSAPTLPPKNTPLTTPLLAVAVALIVTLPEIFQTNQMPLAKLEIFSVSRMAFVTLSTTLIVSALPVGSQSRA